LVNDRHPSGTIPTPAPASDAAPAPYASYGTQEAQYGDFTTYGDYDATGFTTGGPVGTDYGSDPLFGTLPAQNTGAYDTSAAYDTTGTYDTAQWAAAGHQNPQYDAYPDGHQAGYDTGAYDTGAWTAAQPHLAVIPPQATGDDTSGQWDAAAWLRPDQSGNPAEQTQQWEWGAQTFDTGAYDATQWNVAAPEDAPPPGTETQEQRAEAPFERFAYEDDAAAGDETAATGELPAVGPLLDGQEEVVPASRAASRGGGRSRRRQPAKRSALLTIAVPSACVMGVAGIAAASVSTLSGDDTKETAASAADTPSVKPATANNRLDTQLQSLAAGADDFADRASRTQERIDLKAQQAAEKKRAAQEAARKERLRPKFALPVAQHGLSAYYGQSGINWMSVHSGIDFPVAYGTTVMAATDGTVRTQWNSAYGNMMIVTAKDGTETWYCHLSSYRVPSGATVKAGDPIAYSGNSGNSTGPHLHFEVRPGGGSAIDPLAWLRSHGLDPS
jgi:murein DD-endopeptidase MepM/ murein hydrolase activator NlpD